MESHPGVQSTVGVASFHSAVPRSTTLSDLDISIAHDLLVIAVQIILQIKVYDWSVLNPYNFTAVCMLEHGRQYY